MAEVCPCKQTLGDGPFILEKGVAQIAITAQTAKEEVGEVGGEFRDRTQA